MFLQHQPVVDARRQLFFIMRNHDKRLARIAHKAVYNSLSALAVTVVKPVKRLVKNKQIRVLDKGTYQHNQALLARRQRHIVTISQMRGIKGCEPRLATSAFSLRSMLIQTYRVAQSTCHNINSRQRFAVGRVHLGRHITNAALYVPNAFTAPALITKQPDIASISLRIISTHQRQQRTFARPILAGQGPVFASQFKSFNMVRWP